MRLMPELKNAIISPSVLRRPKVSRLANRRERGITMLKKEGSLKKSSFTTSKKGAFSININSVRSNIIPMSNMKLKKKKPNMKEESISFRI